jgi:hypothetical protein
MKVIGRPDELQATFGLTSEVSSLIAGIIVFAANVEYHLEQAIWHIQGHSPRGVRHETDAKQPTELIAMLRAEGEKMDAGAGRDLIALWCTTAASAFHIRHDIAHGVSVGFTDSLMFIRNPRWRGEERKRPSSTQWGDDEQLGLIRDVFAVLLRVAAALSKCPADEIATPDVLSAMRTARSVSGEFASGHNPSFEKY